MDEAVLLYKSILQDSPQGKKELQDLVTGETQKLLENHAISTLDSEMGESRAKLEALFSSIDALLPLVKQITVELLALFPKIWMTDVERESALLWLTGRYFGEKAGEEGEKMKSECRSLLENIGNLFALINYRYLVVPWIESALDPHHLDELDKASARCSAIVNPE